MGQRLQGLSSIGCGLNVGFACFEKCSRRRQDDEIHDQIREQHSQVDIPSRIFHLGVRSPAPLRASHAAETDFFFDFLIGLPEK